MSLTHSPKIVTNGLVFHYDMNNTKKSFLGAPITNLFLPPSPNTFNNSLWASNAGGTVIASSNNMAPDGSLTASKIMETATTDYHRIGQNISASTGLNRRCSFYAKAGERTLARGWSWAGGDTTQQTFDLKAGTCSGSQSPTIDYVTAGWYRCAFTVPAANINNVIIGPSDGTLATASYLGDASKGIYIWHAQLEVSTYANPFTDTARSNSQVLYDIVGNNSLTASSLTYASDNTFSFNGTTDYIGIADSVSLKPSSITVCVWAQVASISSYQVLASKRDLSTYGWEISNSSGTLRVTMRPDGVTNNIFGGTLAVGEKFHAAFSFDGTTLKLYKNGIQTGTVTSSTPVLNGTNRMIIGGRTSNTDGIIVEAFYNGNIYSTSMYNCALTASEVLQNFNATKSRYGL